MMHRKTQNDNRKTQNDDWKTQNCLVILSFPPAENSKFISSFEFSAGGKLKQNSNKIECFEFSAAENSRFWRKTQAENSRITEL